MTLKERIKKQIKALDDARKQTIFYRGQKRKFSDEFDIERILASKELFKKYIGFFRWYPDLFVDLVNKNSGSNFKFFFYQRLFLRAISRHRLVFITCCRAFSKSFLGVLYLMIYCILYPQVKVAIVSGTKGQAASIIGEKYDELLEMMPFFRREINHRASTRQRDYIRIVFKNGSKMDVLALSSNSRGSRRSGILFDEAILFDFNIVNEVIMPTLNVTRRAANGKIHPQEITKFSTYITSAGYAQSEAYTKNVQALMFQIVKGNAICLGGDWRIPVAEGLLEKDFVQELKLDGTFNELGFQREYESIWSGSVDGAFFSAEKIEASRVLTDPEFKAVIGSTPINLRPYYVIGVDVATSVGKDSTSISIVKVCPRQNTYAIKKLVNLLTINNSLFEEQAKVIKELKDDYNAKMIVIDANGPGIGLAELLMKPTLDKIGQQIFPGYSVVNDDRYDQFKSENSIPCLYTVKANREFNSLIYLNLSNQFENGRLELLQSETIVKNRLLSNVNTKKLTAFQRSKILAPYAQTTALKEELLNLRLNQNDNQNNFIELKRTSIKILKDRVSSLAYTLYYIKLEEDKQFHQKKKKYNLKDLQLYTSNRKKF